MLFSMLMGFIGFIVMFILLALTWESIVGFFAFIGILLKILSAAFILYFVYKFFEGIVEGVKEGMKNKKGKRKSN